MHEHLSQHLSPDRIENFWRRLFPGEIPDRQAFEFLVCRLLVLHQASSRLSS